jgi:hypothetical protein
MDGFSASRGFAGLFDIVHPIKSSAPPRTSTFAVICARRPHLCENVIYGLAFPGPRGAQRHRVIRGLAQGFAAQRLNFISKNWVPDRRGGFAAACPRHELADVIYAKTSSMSGVPRTAWRVAPRVIRGPAQNWPRSGSVSFLKSWIPDRRDGFAAACPGHEAADVIYAKTSSMVGCTPDRVARSAIA